MEWIEVTGRTVDEAKERALDELGVHESELEFELLDDARGGFLGRIGRSDARIRARIKPLSREKPADKRRRRRHEGRGEGSESSGGSRGRRPRPARSTGGTAATAAAPDGAGSVAESSRPPTTPKPRSRSRSRPRQSPNERVPQSIDEEQTDMETEVNLDEQEAVAVELGQGLLDALGATGSVQAGRTDDDGITIDVVGSELGLLVGPKGAT